MTKRIAIDNITPDTGQPPTGMGLEEPVHRDSKDGQFVTKRQAETHPDTTEKERVRVHLLSLPRKGKITLLAER